MRECEARSQNDIWPVLFYVSHHCFHVVWIDRASLQKIFCRRADCLSPVSAENIQRNCLWSEQICQQNFFFLLKEFFNHILNFSQTGVLLLFFQNGTDFLQISDRLTRLSRRYIVFLIPRLYF